MTLPAGTDAVRQSLASFRQEREADWKAFEALLARVEKRAPRTLVGRRAAVAAAALPFGAVVAVGGARDVARQCAGRLSGSALPARLFLSLRRAARVCDSASAISSCATGRRRSATCGARPWSRSG